MSRNIYIFMGPPGAGKGSLAHLCIKQLGWKQLSTGNLCRYHIAAQTKIGEEIDFFIKSGKLIPDGLMVEMVKDWLLEEQNNAQAFILDGFPRTVAQAQALDKILCDTNTSEPFHIRIINLVLDDTVVINRLMNRLICQNSECQKVYSENYDGLNPRQHMKCDDCSSSLMRRIDDNSSTVEQRLMNYHKHAHELINYYNDMGRLIERIFVEKPLDEVFGQFRELIKVYKNI